MISITINGRQTNVIAHSTVFQACKSMGITVPHFCYYENLSVAGNCRICLVEIQKAPKPVVSCAMPVSKGRVVFTETPLVRKAREAVLEFLLLNHPLDCPICDQGSECDLQDETLRYASDRGRFFEFKQTIEDKPCGPIVKTIITRCIHCTRCVRFCTEVAGNTIMGNFGRGEESEIGTYINTFIKTELSGNLVDICPVGALTSKPYAFKARQWDLNQKNTIDFFDTILSDIIVCSTPSNISIKQNKVQCTSQIIRILPATNGIYAENWISDRTRYAFDGLSTRLRHNLNSKSTRFNQWNNDNYKININSHVNLEIIYFIQVLFRSFDKSATFIQAKFTPKVNIDIPFFYTLNQKVSKFASNKISILLSIGTNLRYEASLLNTIVRRKQNFTNITIITVAAYNVLWYPQKHQGNSYQSLMARMQNRLNFVKKEIKQKEGVNILVGINNRRNRYGSFIQKIIIQLGKSFFVKTTKNNRLGYIHSSVGSLAFAHTGISNKTNSTKKVLNISIGTYNTKKTIADSFFNIEEKELIIFDTHFETNNNTINYEAYPTTSLYERSGSLISIDNIYRKHIKVTNVPEKGINNLETYNLYWIAKYIGNHILYQIIKKIAKFNINIGISTKSYQNFIFNPFNFQLNYFNYAKLILFYQPVHNFYLEEPMAQASPTIASCFLFLNQETNFNNEI